MTSGYQYVARMPIAARYVYRWRCWADAQDIADRCNEFWRMHGR